jgi:hypothetical protein
MSQFNGCLCWYYPRWSASLVGLSHFCGKDSIELWIPSHFWCAPIIINILGFLVALNLTNIPYRNTTPTSPSSRGSRLESSIYISKYLINLDFPCDALAD